MGLNAKSRTARSNTSPLKNRFANDKGFGREKGGLENMRHKQPSHVWCVFQKKMSIYLKYMYYVDQGLGEDTEKEDNS